MTTHELDILATKVASEICGHHVDVRIDARDGQPYIVLTFPSHTLTGLENAIEHLTRLNEQVAEKLAMLDIPFHVGFEIPGPLRQLPQSEPSLHYQRWWRAPKRSEIIPQFITLRPQPEDQEHEGTVHRGGEHNSPHWRRGHWRRVVCGVGRTGRRLKWIRPVLVNADLIKADKAAETTFRS